VKIYTGRGDDGLTDLRNMDRVSKTSGRIEAYGSVDELNTLVGVARPTNYEDIDAFLGDIQNHLHIVQADLANPEPDEDDPTVTDEHVDAIETGIDEFDAELEPLERFILPGGSEAGARLHHARSVCRRAERRAVAVATEEATINDTAITYLNRLSDALFTLARVLNDREGISEKNPTY
jgi:ATP:cob(I)alamin adenosyltransferase